MRFPKVTEPSSNLGRILPGETTIAGPYKLFKDSFTIEYLRPDPARNASVLLKGTYHAPNTFTKLGKNHPQSPPLHIHFAQAESFVLLQGRAGTTRGYDRTDHITSKEDCERDGPVTIQPGTPHQFWPVADSTEDAVLLIWAHPKGRNDGVYPPSMDHLFFHSLLAHLSERFESNKNPDLGLMMLLNYESESALVMLPGWWFLGDLRWWVPWMLEGAIAAVARWRGVVPIVEKHVGKKSFQTWMAQQSGKLRTA